MLERRRHSRRRFLEGLGAAVLGAPLVACRERGPAARETVEEREVAFTADGSTIHGSLLLPPAPAGTKLPGLLIIGGSGLADRNGNPVVPHSEPYTISPLPEFNTYRTFAHVAAEAGVASMRYDKLGSGRTGWGILSRDEVGFEPLVSTAVAASRWLAGRPEVAAVQITILGHSEGGLIALIVADRLKRQGGPAGLILAAPPGERLLDTSRRQLQDRLVLERRQRDVAQAEAAWRIARHDEALGTLRATGKLPEWVGSPGNRRRLEEADHYDPAALAAALRPDLPVLLLRGSHDVIAAASDIDALLAGFRRGGNHAATAVELPGVNHAFHERASPPVSFEDDGDPSLPFSREAGERIAAFLRA